MSKIPIFNAVRIIPRDQDFLDRTFGSRGEIYVDNANNTLRLYNGQTQGGISLAKKDLTNVSNSDFLAKANSAGFSGGVQSGVAGKIAYYPSNGSQVNDLTEFSWTANTSTLSLAGIINVTGQKNRIRFHWDTLADLTAEVSPVDYHGMVAHVHDTGKLYYAHNGAWVPVAFFPEIIQKIAYYSPFGVSASLSLAMYPDSVSNFTRNIVVIIFWSIIFLCINYFMNKKALKKLSVNG
jgi:hypothetical protein